MGAPALCSIVVHSSIFLLLFWNSVVLGEFVPAGSVIPSISQRSTVKVSQFCGDEIQCRSRLNQTRCLDLNVCQEVKTCNGRSDFPSAEDPLLKWNQYVIQDRCLVSDKKPIELPSTLSIRENTAMLTVNNTGSGGLDSCYISKDSSIGNTFSLSFWIKADCANCTVVELSKDGENPVLVKVVDGDHICIDQTCAANAHLQSGLWAFIAITSYKGTVTFYVDGNKMTDVSYPAEDVVIGSRAVSDDTFFYILYAQFFADVLTPREIKEMDTGLVDLQGKCRCTPDYPIVSDTQDSQCVNAQGQTYPRFTSSVEFKHPDVILDSSPENWASAEQGPVTLTLTFTISYEIESITIGFAEPPPTVVTYRLISDGQERQSRDMECTDTQCVADLGSLDNSATLDQFEDKVADGMKVVLNRDHNDDVRSFILSEITVTGRCDCHGNAASCTTNGNAYTCACDASTNTQGPHCRTCDANFYKRSGEFDCQLPCQCFQDGVANMADQCDHNGGQCICKEHVEGAACDRCKPWTYNLDGLDTKGCRPCPCLQSGSQSCNNVTGVCTCKRNVATPNCHVCLTNHYGFDSPQGCTPCDCEGAGTVGQDLTCNDADGQCRCKDDVEGQNCDSCKAGYFNLQTPNQAGCEPCNCYAASVDNSSCHQTTGQCMCRGGIITDRICTPEILSVDPNHGPLIGATRVTILGKLLGNFTRSVSVCLGNIEQSLVKANDSALIVATKQHGALTTMDLNVGCVGINDTLKAPSPFSYFSDPVLDDSRTVKGSTFKSGGCMVKLYGSHLTSVRYPRLEVRRKDDPGLMASGPCYHIRGMAVCTTPDTSSLYTSSSDGFAMTAVFDGVSLDLGDLEVKPDPVIGHVGNIEFQYPFEDTIAISGKNLLSACETNDYTVHIGVIQCAKTHVSNTAIECEPPTQKPKGPDKVPITVSIGNIQRRVGTLEYLALYETTGFIIIMCCICGVIAIVIGALVARYIYRRRRLTNKNGAGTNSSKATTNHDAHVASRPMNTYSELTSVTNASAYSNGAGSGQNGTIRVESVFLEPKKGIVNSAAETNVLEDEFLPHVEPGLRADVTECFIGGGSFTIGNMCMLTGGKARLVDGILRRQRHTGQKLVVKSFCDTIQENLQAPGNENSLLVSWAQQVIKECLRFRKYKHNHVMRTIGIGVDQQRVNILYEHMSRGTLKNLVSDTQQDYSVRKLLGFGQQVAEGIAFLASKDVTHKDVAARNCMIDEVSVVKLGDAAFAWDFYPQEYVYNEHRERHLPLRWMAPESIDHGYYDMRTDVWSFGVLVWELLTRGCLPFHEVSDSDVTDYILNGYVLGKPETVSDQLYNLLRSCWSPENEGRPSIAAVSSALCNILEADDDGGDTYANVNTPRIRPSSEAHFYSSTNISGV